MVVEQREGVGEHRASPGLRGFGAQRERRVSKPEAGHAARAGLDHAPSVLAEFEPEADTEYEAGQSLTVDLFEVGQNVKITGLTKGRGFQGTVKRHGFGGSRASGTNDKAGSLLNLLRWVSPRTVKETFVPPYAFEYTFLADD